MQTTLYRARDLSGRDIALQVFVPNSGQPEDLAAISLYQRLEHASLVRLHCAGAFADGSSYLALAWPDGASVSTSPRPFPIEAVRRAAFELSAALAFLHEHGIAHGAVGPRSVFSGPAGFTLGGPEHARLTDSAAAARADMAGLGRTLRWMLRDGGSSAEESEAPVEAFSAQIDDADLRGLIERLLEPDGGCTASGALTACSAWVDLREPAMMRRCIGRIRPSADPLAAVIDPALLEARRGSALFLFAEGRWGSDRPARVHQILDASPSWVLTVSARPSSGTLDTARARLWESLRPPLGDDSNAGTAKTPAVEEIAEAARRLIVSAGRACLLLALETDSDPSSGDAAFLRDWIPFVRDLPVVVLAHGSKTPSELPAEFQKVKIELHEPHAAASQFFLPGPAATFIRNRLAIESGGNVEILRQGMLTAIRAHGRRVLDGSWKGGGVTLLGTRPSDFFEDLCEEDQGLLRLLLAAQGTLPSTAFSLAEKTRLRDLPLFVNGLEDRVSLHGDVRRSLRHVAGSVREASRLLLGRLESRSVEIEPVHRALLLAAAGRYRSSIDMLKSAGEAGLLALPQRRASRLLATLSPHASRVEDAEFWAMRGDWAAGLEQHREAILCYKRASAFGGHDPSLARRSARAAESAADYRQAVRIAEAALRRTGEAAESVEMRCIAARCRYLLGDVSAATEHWAAAHARCGAPGVDPRDAGTCLRDYGYFLLRTGQTVRARTLLQQAETMLLDAPGCRAEAAQSRHYLGLLQRSLGEVEAARHSLEEAARIYAGEKKLLAQAMVTSDLGMLHMAEERWAEARPTLELSRDLFLRIRNRRAMTLACHNLAEVMMVTGEYTAARRLLDRSLLADASTGNLRSRAYSLSTIGLLDLYTGNLPESAARLAEAAEIFSAQGDQDELVDTLLKQTRLALHEKDLEAAGRFLRAADEKMPRHGSDSRLRVEFDLLSARLSLCMDRVERCLQSCRKALGAVPLRAWVRGEAGMLLAEAALSQSRPAAAHYRDALEHAERSGNVYLQLQVRLSVLEGNSPELRRAEGFLAQTEELLERSGNAPMIRRYCDWHAANRQRLGLGPLRRLVPAGVESAVYRIHRRVGKSEASGGAVVPLVMEAILEGLAADACMLAVRDRAGAFSVAARRGSDNVPVTFALRLAEQSIEGSGVQLRGEDDPPPAELAAVGIVSAMAVPVMRGAVPSAAIYLDRRAPADLFTLADADFAMALTEGLALGLGAAIPIEASRAEAGRHESFASIRAVSDAMNALLDAAARVAPRDVNVLITGESGTGKELLARAIHDASGRGRAPFVPVNCSAIPDALLESEFFGYRRGAFTDARSDHAGLIEEADGGTLFLDEIGEMPLKLQAKLLRLIQEREFRRIGETRTRSADLRILSATNRDLQAEVAAGTFREDLYYRLQVVTLRIPPLRERREDILVLAEHYLSHYARSYASSEPRLGPSARAWLLRQRWPGNVRELQNAVQRALLGAEQSPALERQHFETTSPQDGLSMTSQGKSFEEACARFEKALLTESLRKAGFNRAECARQLGLSRQGLFKLLKKHQVRAE